MYLKTFKICVLKYMSLIPLVFSLHQVYNDLPFLAERMKIKKVEKLVANLHDKTMLYI